MRENLEKPEVLGLVFRYHHFYGDYVTLNPWFYHKEVRIIRNNGKVRSIGDAVGFYCTDDAEVKNLKSGDPARWRMTGCHIFHYGWVKNPRTMLDKKIHQMSKHLEMTEDELREAMGKGREALEKKGLKNWDTVLGALTEEWSFEGYDFMKEFRGTHPAVMRERIGAFIPYLKRDRNRWLNPRFYGYVFRHGFKG
jgi:hypothetical protein